MHLRKGIITEEVAKLILSWGHSGLNVRHGPDYVQSDEAVENIAKYIVRASFTRGLKAPT